MALKKLNEIVLETKLGVSSTIEFMCGDITKLPVEDKVDIVLVSAFANDYSPVRTTLIGALHQNLGLSVYRLSKEKDVDLRKNFSCWVSRPLPEEYPYRRVVCFERMHFSGTITEQISGVYRAFTPIFNNEETTVITPLLGSGNQGECSSKVLQAMVDGACGWILSGLPLRNMKIVIYSQDVNQIYKRDMETINVFKKLKAHWEKTAHKRVLSKPEKVLTYDVYLSYSPTDQSCTDKIIKKLHQIQPKMKLYSNIIAFQKDDVWQEKIYQVMVKSKRIIVVLSPAYIASEKCLEQFNMALCCSRLKRQQVVAPFYIETVPSLPSYILLVQYVECRIRSETDDLDQLIKSACVKVKSSLEEDQVQPVEFDDVNPKYDVFISYAHKTPKDAEYLLKLLQERCPTLSIFYDKDELTTGSVWQKTLYESIDSATIVVAMITDAYLKSTVCNEEYNIALARFLYLSQGNIFFVPVCCEDLQTIPEEFSHVPMVDNRKTEHNEIETIADAIVTFKTSSVVSGVLTQENRITEDIGPKMEEQRKLEFHKHYKIIKEEITLKESRDAKTNQKVVISFSQNCLKYALALQRFLETDDNTVSCVFLGEKDNDRLMLLDKADRIVVLVSEQYIKSTQLMEEFYIAMCRQRMASGSILYFIQTSPISAKPTFMNILPYSISLLDGFWRELSTRFARSDVHMVLGKDEFRGSFYFTTHDVIALKTAAVDIQHGLPDGSNWKNIINVMSVENATEVPLEKCLRSDANWKEVKLASDVVLLSEIANMEKKSNPVIGITTEVENSPKVSNEEVKDRSSDIENCDTMNQTSPKNYDSVKKVAIDKEDINIDNTKMNTDSDKAVDKKEMNTDINTAIDQEEMNSDINKDKKEINTDSDKAIYKNEVKGNDNKSVSAQSPSTSTDKSKENKNSSQPTRPSKPTSKEVKTKACVLL